jgi:protein O-mannosyl-transferase
MKPKKKRTPPASRPASISRSVAKRPRPRYWLACLALGVLTLVAFWNSFSAGFALDNQMLLLGDPRIRQASLLNVGLILKHSYWWPNGESGLYRPLTTLSYLFNYSILGNGSDSTGYHLVNLFAHAANVLLVFAVALRLLGRRAGAFRTAFLIAALWAVHPLLTESVTNLAGRADLFAATAILGGFLIYLKTTETTGSRRAFWLIGLSAVTTAGVFSKESAVVLPGIIILYELVWWREGKGSRAFPRSKLFWGCLATILPIVAMLAARAVVLSSSPPAEWPFVDNPIAGAGYWIGRLTAVKVLGRYLSLAFWPVTLSSDYSYSEIPLARGSLDDWIAWLAVAAALVIAIRSYRIHRPAFFFACFAFLNLLPASNLLFPIGTIMAERLLYLPLVGIVAFVVIAMNSATVKLHLPQTALPILLGLIAGGFIVRTWLRNSDWKNNFTMATVSVKTSPNSFKVHRLLAAELLQSGSIDTNIDRAVAEADKSVAILSRLPDDLDIPDPWTVAATCHLAKANLLPQSAASGQYQEAVKLALRSIAVDTASRAAYYRRHGVKGPVPPSSADAYRVLASSYLHLGQPEVALPAAIQARDIDPTSVEVYGEIADAYIARRRQEDAAIALAEGMFATGDHSLRDDLLKIYQNGDIDASGCAVVPGPRGPALNPSCEIVRRDLCAGAARAHRPDLSRQLACPN